MKRRMGTFRIDAEFAGLRHPQRFTRVPRLLVDTGSEYTWIPEALLRAAGVRPVKKDVEFLMANGQTITRSIGYVILRTEGFETVDEAVFGQPGDLALLGARTLEGFGARVDVRSKRLVASGPHPAALALAEGQRIAPGLLRGSGSPASARSWTDRPVASCAPLWRLRSRRMRTSSVPSSGTSTCRLPLARSRPPAADRATRV